MTLVEVFWLSVGCFILSIVLAAINMLTVSVEKATRVIALHIISWLVASASSIAAVVSGAIWLWNTFSK